MASSSKQKGSEFERKICRLLSLWVSDLKRDDVFWRSAMSGGSATVALKKGKTNKSQVGDISVIAPDGYKLIELFVIECKAYKEFFWDQLVFRREGMFSRIWADLGTISDKVDKRPMLIAKRNHTDTIVCLDRKGWELLSPGQTKKTLFIPTVVCPRIDMHVFLFKDLLQTNVRSALGM